MFQLVLLLLCVPLQLCLVHFNSSIERKFLDFVGYIKSTAKQFDLWNVLVKWTKYSDSVADTESSVSVDREKETYPSNEVIRSHRPDHVFLRVGFVVLQIKSGYTGIIIGWRISDEGEPIYEILTRHPEVKGYRVEAPQQLLYPLQYTEISHPELNKYFEGYNGATQYTPLPWLRNLYPLD